MTPRKLRFLPIAAAFAAFGALEIAFVLLVASDPYTRIVFISLLATFQVAGAILFHRLLTRPPRRRR